MNQEKIKCLSDKQNDQLSCFHDGNNTIGNNSNSYELTDDLLLTCKLWTTGSDDSTLEKLKKKLDINFDAAKTDPEFCQFLFSSATNMIIMKKEGESLVADELEFLQVFLSIGIEIKYYYLPRSKGEDVSDGSDLYRRGVKYLRDCTTDRGKINVCSRETKRFCGCMNSKKLQAKNMEKIGMCYGCEEYFPKMKLSLCIGCIDKQYCSLPCRDKDWSKRHKNECPRLNFQRCDTCDTLIPAKELKESCRFCNHQN
jgi:hypothetical protein